MFHLDVIKADLVFKCCSWTHLSQPRLLGCVHACERGGARAADVGNGAALALTMRAHLVLKFFWIWLLFGYCSTFVCIW